MIRAFTYYSKKILADIFFRFHSGMDSGLLVFVVGMII